MLAWTWGPPPPAGAQQVDAVGDLVATAVPGGTVTFVYRVSNAGGEPLELAPVVTHPSDWKLLSGGRDFVLGPLGSDVQLVSFALPATAPAGEYRVGYAVSLPGSAVEEVATDRRVTVAAVDRLEVVLLESPRYVLAGDRYEAVFRVANESNRRHLVRLEARQSGELSLEWDPSTLDIAARESAVVRIAAATPPSLVSELRHQIVLVARLEERPSVADAAVVDATILPERTTSDRRWHRLGGELTVRALAERSTREGSRTEPNATLILGGALDDGGRRQIELFLQGPEVRRGGPLGSEREELYGKLSTPAVELILGDFDPTPSRLVRRVHGRGASVRFDRGRWQIGGRRQETPRQSRHRVEESALAGGVEIGRHAARIEYVERTEPATGSRGEIVDLGAILRPLESLSLRLSLAHGRLFGRSAQRTEGFASEVEIAGERRAWSYNLLYLYGDDGFPGSAAGRSSLYGGFGARLTPRLSARSTAHHGQAREEPDVVYSVRPIEIEYSNGLHYRASERTLLSLERRNSEREEVSEVAAVNLRETTYRLAIRQQLANGDVTMRIEAGEGDDRVARSTFDLERYTLLSSYRPSQRLDLQAELEQTRETTRDGEADDALSALVRAKVQLSPRLELDGYYRQREREFRTASSTAYSSLRLARELPRSHQVALALVHSRSSHAGRETDRAVVLEYTLPLSVPIKRRTTAGSLLGRVRSEQGGRPLPGVLIRIGGAVARSREDGSFSIAALEAGSHPLVVDTAGLGYRQLSSPANPELVTVEGGGEQRLDLWVTAAGVVRGAVTRGATEAERWATKDRSLAEQQPEALIPVAGVVLELADGRTTLRRLTDADGRFTFEPLQPGSWTLRVKGPVPAGLSVTPAERALEVGPGEEIDAPIRLVAERARQRRIPGDRDAPLEVVGFSATGQE